MEQYYKLDIYCPDKNLKVYQDYDFTLNQTDIKTNKNKFYIAQILTDNTNYYLYTRYGRVGNKGVCFLKKMSEFNSINVFHKTFKSKTGNEWNNRKNFKKYKNKYFLCDIQKPTIENSNQEDPNNGKDLTVKSELSENVQKFIENISDKNLMKQNMIKSSIDIKKLPLGKITLKQIQKGYEILKQIEKILSSVNQSDQDYRSFTDQDNFLDLSNDFYTLIPYSCGIQRPPIIDNINLVKESLKRLDILKEIETNISIIKSSNILKYHPIDNIYKSLDVHISELNMSDPAAKMIQKYVDNTHGSTHNSYNLEIMNIFNIQKKNEIDRYNRFVSNNIIHDVSNKMLLWHGSRTTNFMGILKNSLKIAPPEAPCTGYMFDKGVYFANSVSKSANYCRTDSNNNIGFLLLCEVALGKLNKKKEADCYAATNLNDCDSTWGLGKNTMNTEDFCVYGKDIVVPFGKLVKSNIEDTSLLYDEFIIYNECRARIHFIVKVKFNYK